MSTTTIRLAPCGAALDPGSPDPEVMASRTATTKRGHSGWTSKSANRQPGRSARIAESRAGRIDPEDELTCGDRPGLLAGLDYVGAAVLSVGVVDVPVVRDAASGGHDPLWAVEDRLLGF